MPVNGRAQGISGIPCGRDLFGCFEAHPPITHPHRLRKRSRSQGPSLRRNYPVSTVLCLCPTPARSAAICDDEAATSDRTGLPRCPHHPSGVPCPLPRRIERVHLSIASPSVRPFPFCRRVGIRISTFEACSGFTRVTARRIAQPPKAAFVTRLRSGRLPNQTARQLPEQSTTLLPPLVKRAFGAHCRNQDIRFKIKVLIELRFFDPHF